MAHISLPTTASNTCSQPAWPHAASVSNTVWHQGAHSYCYHCNRTTKTSTLLKLCSWTLFRSISVLCLRLWSSRDSVCEPLWLHPLGQTWSPWASALLPGIIPQDWQLQCSKSPAAKPRKLKDYMGRSLNYLVAGQHPSQSARERQQFHCATQDANYV